MSGELWLARLWLTISLISLDHERLRHIVALELHELYEKRNHKTVMRLQKKNPNQIWKYYQKLMSGGKDTILPPFPVFLSLSAVQLLQSRDLASAMVSVKSTVSEKGFVKDLIKQQITQWVDKAKHDLLKTIDPSGALAMEWKTRVPTTKAPHPVLRPDALWNCKICNSVDDQQAIDECLTFVGVCRHQCKEKGEKKKRGTTSHPWSADNFIRDEQVSKHCLEKWRFLTDHGGRLVKSWRLAWPS